MKKRFLVFLSLCVLVSLFAGCSNRQNTPFGYGLELIEDLEVLINSDDVLKLYSINYDRYRTEIDRLRSVDYSRPQAVYRITFDDRELFEAVNGKGISDEVIGIFESRTASAIASSLNSKEGTDSVILAAIYNVGSAFDCKAVEENMVYFYVYDGAVVSVSFTDGDGDACQASASLVMNSSFDVSNAESLDNSLESIIKCSFDVKKVY